MSAFKYEFDAPWSNGNIFLWNEVFKSTNDTATLGRLIETAKTARYGVTTLLLRQSEYLDRVIDTTQKFRPSTFYRRQVRCAAQD